MKKYNKVIFVCMENTCRSPVAEVLLNNIKRDEELTVTSRGIIVLFPEPYNPKAISLLRNNGMILDNRLSVQLTEEDFAEQTLILTMDRQEKEKILNDFENPINVYTIMEYGGGSGDLMDPYGGDMDVYTLFFESISNWVRQVEKRIYEENNKEDNDDSIRK